jgi:hypothetical protein
VVCLWSLGSGKTPARVPDLHLWDYFAAIFNVYAAATFYRDVKLRKNYPYGVAGICLMALVLAVRIAAHWAKGFPETQSLFWASMMMIKIASPGLILAEGVRWFRGNVKLTWWDQFAGTPR